MARDNLTERRYGVPLHPTTLPDIGEIVQVRKSIDSRPDQLGWIGVVTKHMGLGRVKVKFPSGDEYSFPAKWLLFIDRPGSRRLE